MRHAGIGLRRKRLGGDGPHPFQRVQHGHGANTTITSHDLGAPGFNLRPVMFGSRSIQTVPVLVDGDLCDYRQLRIHIASGKNCLVQLFQVSEGLQDHQIYAFFVQGRDLLAKSITSLGKRDLAERLDTYSQRANCAGNQGVEALGGLAGEASAPPIDVSQLVQASMLRQAKRIAPKVFVSMTSAPAWRYS